MNEQFNTRLQKQIHQQVQVSLIQQMHKLDKQLCAQISQSAQQTIADHIVAKGLGLKDPFWENLQDNITNDWPSGEVA